MNTEKNQVPQCDKTAVSGSPFSEVYLMDCMDLMARYPDNYFDLAVVDPPYGIGMDNQKVRVKPNRPNSYLRAGEKQYNTTDWDSKPPDKEYFKELFRVSKNQIIWGANYFCEYLPSGNGWIFWNKLNGLNNCFSDGEFAFSSKGVQSRYFECSTFDGLKGGKDRIHPTQKPVKLYEWLLKNYAQPTDKILDTHFGSCSIGIACHNFGCSLDACELDEEYFDNAFKRVRTHVRQLDLFK